MESDKNSKSILNIKLISGKIKPKITIGGVVGIFIFSLLLIATVVGFVYGIVKFDIVITLIGGIGFFSFGYLLLISPYTQFSKNYIIEFPNENSLVDFKLIYKGKQVLIKYGIDITGKLFYVNNNSKLSCISYLDGSNMSNFTKYKIINYFTRWLEDNDLISNEVTSSLEEL